VNTARKCDFLLIGETSLGATHEKDELNLNLVTNVLDRTPTTVLGYVTIGTVNGYEALCIQAYQRFVDREFAATFEIALWQRVIINMARIEQYVRNGLIAIGALVRHRAGYAAHRLLCEYEYSLMHYNLAIVELNRRLDNSAHSRELAILGAFLFAAFEIIQGHEEKAQMHSRSAFTILKSFPQTFPRSASEEKSLKSPSPKNTLAVGETGHLNGPSTSDVIALFNAFSRLDPQAASSSILNSLTSSQMPVLPPKFTGLVQAREYLFSITNSMGAIFAKTTLENKTLPYSPLPISLTRDLSMIQDALDTWFRHFSSLTSNIQTNDIHTAAIIKVLLIYHGVANIQALTHFFRDELTFDLYTYQFEQIMSLARAAREADKVRALAVEASPCFIFDIGMVQPMFYIARKCRNSGIRRAAIKIMEEIRGKKVLAIRLLAQVARWIVTVEEEELDLGNGFVAEHKRLHDIDLDYSSYIGRCRVTAWQRKADGKREDVTAVICSVSYSN
jgi:hypothetical protein